MPWPVAIPAAGKVAAALGTRIAARPSLKFLMEMLGFALGSYGAGKGLDALFGGSTEERLGEVQSGLVGKQAGADRTAHAILTEGERSRERARRRYQGADPHLVEALQTLVRSGGLQNFARAGDHSFVSEVFENAGEPGYDAEHVRMALGPELVQRIRAASSPVAADPLTALASRYV